MTKYQVMLVCVVMCICNTRTRQVLKGSAKVHLVIFRYQLAVHYGNIVIIKWSRVG